MVCDWEFRKTKFYSLVFRKESVRVVLAEYDYTIPKGLDKWKHTIRKEIPSKDFPEYAEVLKFLGILGLQISEGRVMSKGDFTEPAAECLLSWEDLHLTEIDVQNIPKDLTAVGIYVDDFVLYNNGTTPV